MSDYDTDILTWSERQAALLRRIGAGEKVNDQVDWENVAEEIEALGRSERSALENPVATIIEHLAKLEASPAIDPRMGWQETIVRTRANVAKLIQRGRKLRDALDQIVADEHATALQLVARLLALHGETPLVPLDPIHFTQDQVLSDWFPDGLGPT